jgi:hypothetical protein
MENNGNNKKNNERDCLGPLTFILVLQTTSSPLSSFLGSKLVGFPSKMIPCKCHHNLAFLCFRPLSKGLGSNLWFLANGIIQFHWTLPLGPSCEVPFKHLCKLCPICLVNVLIKHLNLLTLAWTCIEKCTTFILANF